MMLSRQKKKAEKTKKNPCEEKEIGEFPLKNKYVYITDFLNPNSNFSI